MTLLEHGKTDDNKYFFEVSVDAEAFNKAIETAYKKASKKIEIPGFRKGHAPKNIIEAKYGEGFFFDDAIDELLPDCYSDALDRLNLEVIDRPSVDIKSVDKVNGFTARFEVVLRPELTIKKYKGLSAKKTVEKIDDEKVDAEIKDIQYKQSRLVSVDDRETKLDDTVTFDFEGFVDGVAFDGGKAEKYTLVLGSGQFIPGFEEQMVGKKVGEEFDVTVKFPDDYGADNLAGKEAVFKIKLHEIRFREMPDIDDELAKDCDFDTLDALKADIRARLEKEAADKADAEFENELMKTIAAGIEDTIPEVMVNDNIDEMVRDYEYRLSSQGLQLADYLKYTGSDINAFKESFREQSLEQVKIRLALEAIARAEKFEVTEEEVEAEYKRMADKYEIEIDKIKNMVSEKEVKKDMLTNKALDCVKENAKAAK